MCLVRIIIQTRIERFEYFFAIVGRLFCIHYRIARYTRERVQFVCHRDL